MQTSINRVLNHIVAFFGTGIALILLNCFYNAMNEYSALIMRILALSAVVLILSFVAYVSVNIFLTIEYRATQNEIFKDSRQELLTDKSGNDDQPNEMDTERKILDLYHEMTASNSLSLNQIALEVWGKKGGYYNNQIREVLSGYNIDI